MWEVVADILNIGLTASITFHYFLHRFRSGHSTGTATLKVKLLHQLAAWREEVLSVIFLDLQKVCDVLDRSRCLEILGATVWDPEHAGSSGHTGVS